MQITLKCQCGRNLQVSQELAGREITCPYCATVMFIPIGRRFPGPAQPETAPMQSPQAKQVAKPARKPLESPAIDVRFWITLLVVLLMLSAGVAAAVLFFMNNPPGPVVESESDNVEVRNEISTIKTSSGIQRPNSTAGTTPFSTIRYEKELWFILSDFKQHEVGEMFEFSANFQHVQGEAAIGNYVWVVVATLSNQPTLGKGEKQLESFVEFPFDAKSNQGTLRHLARITQRTSTWATFLGLRMGNGRYERISAELELGGFPTAGIPPTPKEQAGLLAEGMSIALANARYQPGDPTWELLVDYEILNSLQNKQCFLVMEGADDDRIELDVTSSIATAKPRGTIVVTKPANNLLRPIMVLMETRQPDSQAGKGIRIGNPTPLR